jgi:uncharacterized protein (TIGR03000 family)
MLRRRIPSLGLAALVVAVLLVTAESASAQLRDRLRSRRDTMAGPTTEVVVQSTATNSAPMRFRDRLRSRFGRTEAPMYVAAAPVTTTQATTAPATVTPTTETPVMTRRGRFFGRRTMMTVPVQTTPAPMPGATTPPTTTRTAFYAPDAPTTATISVRVPASAMVMFDGQKTTQTGTFRQFVSPTLERGSTYTYQIQAKWTENGREFDQTRTINVLAGREVVVDFMPPAPQRRLLRR